MPSSSARIPSLYLLWIVVLLCVNFFNECNAATSVSKIISSTTKSDNNMNFDSGEFFSTKIMKKLNSPSSSSNTTQHIQAVRKLMERVFSVAGSTTWAKNLAKRNVSILLAPHPNHNDDDSFTYRCQNNFLEIQATNGVSAAAALHHYMRFFLNSSVTWGVKETGYQIHVPASGFPDAPETTSKSLGSYRYYMNVCTLGYTTAFWAWNQWERHLDWMALHGINLPLASEGMEYVWWRTYTENFTLTTDNVTSYFTGPAYLPWNRMGNIHTWAGPMSVVFMKSRSELQKKILKRMRSFGMHPVLPAFDGHVPGALRHVFPNATFVRSADWLGDGSAYSENYLLEPTSDLFPKIASVFMQKLTEEYGASDFYNADTYNEMDPRSTNLAFLQNSSRAVYQGIVLHNPNAIWVMQGWLFWASRGFWSNNRIQAYLSGSPPNGLLILDLTSDLFPQFPRTNGYFGYNFIWCMLHNYGGRRGLYGNVSHIGQQPVLDYTQGKYPSMVGVGLTMEAIDQNLLIYELMLDVAWIRSPLNSQQLQNWVVQYSHARYGALTEKNQVSDEARRKKTNLLLTSRKKPSSGPYEIMLPMMHNNGPLTWFVPCCFHFATIIARPWLNNLPFRTWVYYNPDPVIQSFRVVSEALRSYSDPSSLLQDYSTFRYDAIDIARQTLSNFFTDYQQGLLPLLSHQQHRQHKTTTEDIINFTAPMLTIVKELDDLMSSDENFLFGRWVSDARAIATNPSEEQLFDFNARAQVSMWGPAEHVHDYAGKPWGGLIQGYHYPRWKFLFDNISKAFISGENFNPNRTAFDLSLYKHVDLPFVSNSSVMYPRTATSDAYTCMALYYEKYFVATALNNTAITTIYSHVSFINSPNSTFLEQEGILLWTAWHKDMQVLYNLCNIAPLCVAFTSEGYMLSSIPKFHTVPSSLSNLTMVVLETKKKGVKEKKKFKI